MRLSPAGTGEGVVELPGCSTTSRVFLLVVAMAKDLTEPKLEEEGEETMAVKLIFEQAVLVASKKVNPDDVSYLQINIQKLPKTRTVSDESSEHLRPTSVESPQVHFTFIPEEAEFDLKLDKNLPPSTSQYEVELEIMRKNERKDIGKFDVRICDIESVPSKKTKWRKVVSTDKTFQTIELKYRVCQNLEHAHDTPDNRTLINVVEKRIPYPDNQNPFDDSSNEKPSFTEKALPMTIASPRFRPGSCIMVTAFSTCTSTKQWHLHHHPATVPALSSTPAPAPSTSTSLPR